jgi:hypothetical protein
MKTNVNCGLQLFAVYSDFIVYQNVQLFLTTARQVGQQSIGAMSLVDQTELPHDSADFVSISGSRFGAS